MNCIIRILVALIVFSLSFVTLFAKEYTTVKLWKRTRNVLEICPELRVYFPNDSVERQKTCILICPGGSYHHLGLHNEGSEVAEIFTTWGVTAVVLRYRVSSRCNHHPAMIEDFQRAMQIIRERASEWGIEKVGAIGFSAGGHLVALGAELHENYLAKRDVSVGDNAIRPDFVCPIYPVVSADETIAHKKSINNFFGGRCTEEEKDFFSLEKHVPSDMPPTFLLACKDDDVVDYRNSVFLYKALIQQNIRSEFYLLDSGGHGFGFTRTKSEETNQWYNILKKWMIKNDFLK